VNTENEPRPVKPVLRVISFSGDILHVLGFIYFLDPDLAELRQYNVEATAGYGPFTVTAAGSQKHLPGGDPYLEEATRIAGDLLKATYPHFTRGSPDPS
jgi:hypothetical protein